MCSKPSHLKKSENRKKGSKTNKTKLKKEIDKIPQKLQRGGQATLHRSYMDMGYDGLQVIVGPRRS